MPNCAIYGCGTSKRHSLSLFKLPGRKADFYVKWKSEILNIITRDRIVDSDFKALIENDKVYICERHFKPEEIEYTSKYILMYFFFYLNKYTHVKVHVFL